MLVVGLEPAGLHLGMRRDGRIPAVACVLRHRLRLAPLAVDARLMELAPGHTHVAHAEAAGEPDRVEVEVAVVGGDVDAAAELQQVEPERLASAADGVGRWLNRGERGDERADRRSAH